MDRGAAPAGRGAAGRGNGLGCPCLGSPRGGATALSATEQGGPALVWCPCPDSDAAARLADTLLDERLIACANLFPGLRSFYQWNGERGEGEEAGMLLKTDATLLPRLLARIDALHPYDTPAVLAWRCDATTPATAAWLGGLLA